MEIVLKDLCCKSSKVDKRINNVSYVFKESSINFCGGLSGKLLKDLLFLEKKQSSGYIVVNKKGTIRDIGYVGNNPLKSFKTKVVRDEMQYINDNLGLNYKDIDKRVIDALKLVGLNDTYFGRKFSTLSTSELKKVELACVLFYNPSVIILDYFDKGIVYKDMDYFKKLFRKLKVKYGKNFIICSDEIEKYLDIIDEFVIFNEGDLALSGDKKDLYNDEIYKYIEEPRIMDFIKSSRVRGHELLDYIDIKELIKAIYRDVEAK